MPQTKLIKANRLIEEKSPYLLQHAYNPVNWYPWCEEAFKEAEAKDRPVFLSIGYSTCHWCHVMEKESFEDREVAALLNEYFISVKLDREERPDLDAIYMEACQALTGQGGWPLTIIMTPDKKPFFAGTYFPKDSRYGLPGLMDILPKLSTLWEEERQRVIQAGDELLEIIQETGQPSHDNQDSIPGTELFHDAYNKLSSMYDVYYGGFGGSQKFPIPHNLLYLMRYYKRSGEEKPLKMVIKTLENMAAGGIYDQLGYGFHRYSTDPKWLVPHFEKMLYDQALTVMAYLEAFQVTGGKELPVIAKQVLTYVKRDLLSPEGGFYTAEDADSEGEEGIFYVWSPDEIKNVLSPEQGILFCDYYGITEKGNFVLGKSVLHREHDINEFATKRKLSVVDLQNSLEKARKQLLEVRALRERPFRDEKVITSWNGLMIAAFARAAIVLKDTSFAEIAAGASDFILDNMIDTDGRLLRRYRDGNAAIPAFLDDYAFLVWGLTELYNATSDSNYLQAALNINNSMLALFETENGGLNYSADIEAEVIVARQDAQDGAIPSGNSVAALNLLRLGRITRNTELEEKGTGIIRAFSLNLQRSPTAYTFLLCSLDFAHGPAEEIIITGEKDSQEFKQLREVVHHKFSPHTTLLLHPNEKEGKGIRQICPFLRDLDANVKPAAAYVCKNRACLPPVTEKEQLEKLLK